MMEVSAVISESESSLVRKIHHERHSEHISVRGDLGDFLHNDGCVSYFKMSIGSTNTLIKEHLDDASIGTYMTEDLTNISDTKYNLEA